MRTRQGLDRKDDVLRLGAFSLRPVEQGVALARNKKRDHAASQLDSQPTKPDTAENGNYRKLCHYC